MAQGRQAHRESTELLLDGRVIVIGAASVGDRAVEIWDPATGSFSTFPLQTSDPRWTAEATTLQDGRVLITGGGAAPPLLSTAEILDPTPGAESIVSIDNMMHGRSGHRATLLLDGRVLITGGNDPALNTPTKTAEIFDPIAVPPTAAFTAVGDMRVARRSHTSTLLADGRVLIAGGGVDNAGTRDDSGEIFDPATGTFSDVSNLLQDGRELHASVLLPDGRVLLAGGFTPGVPPGISATADLYDPTTSTFVATGSMGTARAHRREPLLG